MKTGVFTFEITLSYSIQQYIGIVSQYFLRLKKKRGLSALKSNASSDATDHDILLTYLTETIQCDTIKVTRMLKKVVLL